MKVDNKNDTAPGFPTGPVMCVVGAMPDFMEMAPILRALAAHQPPLPVLLVHTSQHFDQGMSYHLSENLGLLRPNLNLEVGSGRHAGQTADLMRRFEPALPHARPIVDTLRAQGGDPRLIDHPRGHGVVTLQGPSNGNDAATLDKPLSALREIADGLPMVSALHPRTRNNIERFGFGHIVDSQRMALLPPQGYLEMLGPMRDATLVLIDSGGLQEETTALGVQCLTLRENNVRPITAEQGTDTLVDSDAQAVRNGGAKVLRGEGRRGHVPELRDSHVADRIAADFWRWLKAGAH